MCMPMYRGAIVVLLVVCLSWTTAQDEGLDIVRKSSDAGLKGLYGMTSSFLNNVQSYTIGDLMEEYNIEKFSDFSDSEFVDDWQNWIMDLLGLVVCVVVGVLFIPGIIIAGCVYCCCRTCCGGCCCNMCTSKAKQQSRPSQCWTLTCTGLALGTSLIMFSMVICAYVTTDLSAEEIEGNMLKDVSKSIRGAENFVNHAADDIDTLLVGNLKTLKDDIDGQLDYLPDSIISGIDNMTQVESSLNELYNFTGSLPELSAAYSDMDSATLATSETNLETKVHDFSTGSLRPILAACGPPCEAAEVTLRDLAVTDIAGDLLDDTVLNTAQTAIDTAIGSDIDGDVKALVANLDQLNQDIETEISGSVDQIKDELENAADSINEAVDGVLETMQNTSFESVAEQVDDVQSDIEPYVEYYRYALMGLTSLMLVVTVMWMIGALMGVLGGSSCKKHGANMMLAGVGFVYLFSWLLMLVTLLTFVVGGMMDLMLCRHIIGFDKDAQAIFQMAQAEFIPDLNYTFTIKELLDDCKQDKSMYVAFRMEDNGYNITEMLDLDQYGVYDELRKLQNMTFNLPPVDVITPALDTAMRDLEIVLNQVDFDQNLDELSKPITEPTDLLDYKKELEDLVAALSSSDPGTAAQIQDEIDNSLDPIIANEYDAVKSERGTIEAATVEGQDISSISLSGIVDNLDKAQDSLNNELDGMVSDILTITVDDLINSIEGFITKIDDGIRNDLITCRPVFDVFQTLTYAPCVYFLYPFNAIWYSYGACLFFCIPGLVFATKTVGYFRRMNRYTKVDVGTIEGYAMEKYDNSGPVVTPTI